MIPPGGRWRVFGFLLVLFGSAQAGPARPVLSIVAPDGEVIQVIDGDGRRLPVRTADGTLLGDLPPAPPGAVGSLSPRRGLGTDPVGSPAPLDTATRIVRQPNPDRCVLIDEKGAESPLADCTLPEAGGPASVTLSATHTTIDSMTTRYSYGSFSPGGSLVLLGSADTYNLSDGTHWSSGAGSYRVGQSAFDHVEVSGSTVRYVLRPPADGVLYQQTDYDSGDHSAQGTLEASGDLVLEATVGSRTAVMHGQARVASNSSTSYGEPRFNYYTAILGSVVPFDLSLTLNSGTWSTTTFMSSFSYTSTGRVDFAAPVSTPPLLGLSVVGSRGVPGDRPVQFFLVGSYEGGAERNLTDAAAWSVEPASLADVAQGRLTISAGTAPGTQLTVRASIVQDGTPREATKIVTVLAAGVEGLPDTWPTYQFDSAHSGHVPVILEPPTFSVRWTRTVAAGRALNPVSGGDGLVFVSTQTYFGGGEALFALDARDGQRLWAKDFGSVFSVNPPAYAYGNVYIQTGDHASDTWLHAFDGLTGDRIFKSGHEAQWERYYAPTIRDGMVYVDGGYYGGMYAFDAFSGGQSWFHALPQYDQWTPAVDDTLAYAYVGSYSPGLYAFDRLTGQASFTIADPNFEWNGWSMNLAPVLGEFGDAIAVHDGRLISFDLAGRRIRWQFDRLYSGQASVAHGTIYALANGRLAAVDERTGADLWSWQAPEGALSGPFIVTESHILVGSATRVHAVDLATRTDAWSYPAAGALSLANDTLYIASANGTLTAIAMIAIAPAALTRLEITGPAEVPEMSQAQFSAVATYDDGRVRDRSLVATWSLSPTTSATLDGDGTLATTELFTPSEPIRLHATYAERGVEVSADRDVLLVIGVSLDAFIERNLRGMADLENQCVATLDAARLRRSAAAQVLLDERGNGAHGDPTHIQVLNHLTQAAHWADLAKNTLIQSLDDLSAALGVLIGLEPVPDATPAVAPPDAAPVENRPTPIPD